MSADQVLPPARGVIHDRGYRRYDGPWLGRFQIVRALTWHSFRSAFGFGRGAKAKILPVIVFLAMCLPAVINTFIVAKGGGRAYGYGTYSFSIRVIALTIFAAVQAPELVSRDLRSRVLPLYFSRPLRQLDYPAAKLAAFFAACLAIVEIPVLLLYLGTIISTRGAAGLTPAIHLGTETRGMAGGLLIGLLWALLTSVISIALASLSGRRAYATGLVAIWFFLTFVLAQVMLAISRHGSATAVGSHLAALISPFGVLDGIRQWPAGSPPGPLGRPGADAAAYGAVFAVLLAASLFILATRYRKAALA